MDLDKPTKAKFHWIRSTVQRQHDLLAKFNELQSKYDILKADFEYLQGNYELMAAKGKRQRIIHRVQSIPKDKTIETPVGRTRAARLKLTATRANNGTKKSVVGEEKSRTAAKRSSSVEMTDNQLVTATPLTPTSMPDDEITASRNKVDNNSKLTASENSMITKKRTQDNDSSDNGASNSGGLQYLRNEMGLIVCPYKKKLRNGYHHKSNGCEQTFSILTDYYLHKKIHAGQRPFHCDQLNCKKSFFRQDHLNNHKRIHAGNKPNANKRMMH